MKWALAAAVALWCTSCNERTEVVNDDTVCTPVPAQPSPDAGYLVMAYSHDDYEHTNPLTDALDQRFYNVETDVWLRSDKVIVGRDSASPLGTLQDMYLEPLKAQVEANGGSVYGDGVQFELWLDLRDGSLGLRNGIQHLLETYPMVSVFSDDQPETPGAVKVVLTGNEESKKTYTNENNTRYAVRDSSVYLTSDPAADAKWQYYGLDWNQWIAWQGADDLPATEARRLACLVGDIHKKGKKVRFWHVPGNEGLYRAMIEYGVDLITTDDLTGLGDFLRGYTP
jgi:glycerophosphoryl diester phosphodiesterase